jgi:hypothetical protein
MMCLGIVGVTVMMTLSVWGWSSNMRGALSISGGVHDQNV